MEATYYIYFGAGIAGVPLALLILAWLAGVRYIPHNKVGIVEKLWSFRGSLKEGNIIAARGEAGYQADLLRGGIHLFYFPWQYSIHKEPLVMVAESKIGYVYARDGEPLAPIQTLGRVVASRDFQDSREFLHNGGQRGRQRAFLREGVYAVNLALFAVITEDHVYSGPIPDDARELYKQWQSQLIHIDGFDPVIVGQGGSASAATTATVGNGNQKQPLALTPSDTIGVVAVHDGPPIKSSEIIAPEVKPADGQLDHNYFQNPEAFLALGGCRGRQLQVLTDGTFFINRWFATVELKPKTLIPIGYVGVVVSYHGVGGEDVTGEGFRYGEQVETGHRGVWKRALPPGKYALNPYALTVEYVPTTNFVLRWITGSVEAHQYDKDLKSIELITADGYEPILPLSLVPHIDYEKAPRVVQRFGDVGRLISQTLDPLLSAYFRDVAQHCHMLDFLTRREEIQSQATAELGKRFKEFDINCIAVLIGRPESPRKDPAGDPIERLFDQLRIRRLAEEQIATFKKQEDAALKLKELNEARASAEKQTELTQTRINIEISGNKGEAELAEARRLAQRDVVRAEGESRSKELLGRGEAARVAQVGLAEAAVFLKKVQAYGDPRFFALQGLAERLAASAQPLVPERMLVMNAAGRDGAGAAVEGVPFTNQPAFGLFGPLLALLLSEKAGLGLVQKPEDLAELQKYAEDLMRTFKAQSEAQPEPQQETTMPYGKK